MSIFEEVDSLRRSPRIPFAGGGSVVGFGPYAFSACGLIGTTGPSQAQVNAAYLATPLNGLVTIVNTGIQDWIVPIDGIYLLEARGAAGGDRSGYYTGGYGVYAKGLVELPAGLKLRIACGQRGTNPTDTNTYSAAGGGGMSVIVDSTSTAEPLLCAGGGGGGGTAENTANKHAKITTSGGNGITGTFGAGGINGSGGGTATYGSGGGGYKTSGFSSGNSFGGGSFLTAALSGGAGAVLFGYGGFGGGGGGYAGAGGGGGYSGGGAGGYSTTGGVGGGGGSYTHARLSDTVLTAAANTGVGSVTITLVEATGGGGGGLLISPRKSVRL